MEHDDRGTDGRVARGQRNRAALVAAFLDLVAAGRQRVTGQQVAEAAGVSVRTVWTHFADLEALYDAASRELWRRYVDERVLVPGDADLATRVDRFAAQRAAENEAIAPFARTAALAEPFSPALRASRARFVGAVRDDVLRLFPTELAGAPERTSAVLAAATYPAWSTLRDDLGLDVDGAAAASTLALRALLAPGTRRS
ncbi:HTH domain-containing protein [Nocardioides sp. ChNu-153]|uniref:TetR/AcrR family transcriptional regulator n=1 Tax=Nocardioides sp. ChNu-153 TaxID=2779364 RepID=UPI00264C41CB|nr:HTH domain-containing protein [Nocardioides sp. ChNu-153]MDN7122045.1 HTH domain-containing protein [Nocardioides sp. ChNu-153]